MVALIILRFVELVCTSMLSYPKHFILLHSISHIYIELIRSLDVLQYEEKF